MRCARATLVLLAISLAPAVFHAAQAPAAAEPSLTKAEMQKFLATAKVRYRESDTVGLVPARAFSTVVRRGERRPQLVVHAPKTLTGPLPAGRKVGYVGVVYRGRVIARVPLLTRAKVPEVGPIQRAVTFISRPGTLALALLLLLAGILLVRRRGRGGRPGSRDHHRHTQRRDRQDPGGTELPARSPPP